MQLPILTIKRLLTHNHKNNVIIITVLACVRRFLIQNVIFSSVMTKKVPNIQRNQPNTFIMNKCTNIVHFIFIVILSSFKVN